MTPARVTSVTALFASLGQMALTSYLTESVVLGVIFYGYGFGLFGRMGSAPAASIGIALYTGQLFFSRFWLRHYRFGPVEWLWRSLTYGRRQRMRGSKAASRALSARPDRRAPNLLETRERDRHRGARNDRRHDCGRALHAGLAISSACSRDRSIPCTLFACSCAFSTTSSSFLPRNTKPHGQLITFSIGTLLRCRR
jgi:hypothetical protein